MKAPAEVKYNDALWVGFNKNVSAVAEIVVDLTASSKVSKFSIETLNDTTVGIEAPTEVEFFYSADGETWTSARFNLEEIAYGEKRFHRRKRLSVLDVVDITGIAAKAQAHIPRGNPFYVPQPRQPQRKFVFVVEHCFSLLSVSDSGVSRPPANYTYYIPSFSISMV